MNERSFIFGNPMQETRELTRGERTKLAILDAAENLILSQGYHGTSMRQIANVAGIAVGGIYNHFANKEAIFFALLERCQPYSDIVSRLPELPGDDVSDLIEGTARLVVDQALADPVFIRLGFIDLQEFGGDTVLQLATQMIQGMITFMGPLVASGQLRDDLPLPVLVRGFAGLLIFYVLSDLVAFADGSPRFEMPFPFSNDIDWVGGMVDLYLNGALRKGVA